MSVQLPSQTPIDTAQRGQMEVWNPSTDHLTRVSPQEVANAPRADEAGQVREPQSRSAEFGATRIDGNATNSGAQTQTETTTGNPILSDPLHQTAGVSISRERTLTEGQDEDGNQVWYIISDQLVFTAGDGDDNIQVTQGANGAVNFDVNGETFETSLARGQEITIRAQGGDDVIKVDSGVTVNFVIEGGEGNDTIEALGSGDNRIFGNEGDDTIQVGTGNNYVYGGAGDDSISVLGEGRNVLYGGDGNDNISGGQGIDYIDAGAGDDRIDGVAGQNILVGSLGSNVIHTGTGDSRVYAGNDTSVVNNGGADVIYAPDAISDRISADDGASNTVVNVVLDPALGQSLVIEGSEEFVSRVQADIAMMQNSPYGQQMLAEFDAAHGNGKSVTIMELQNEQNGYASMQIGYIRNGEAAPGSNVTIAYNPSFFVEGLPAPSVILYHEMAHGFNAVTGTFMPGEYDGGEQGMSHPDFGLIHPERQAVGLPTSHPDFDFGNGRITNTNPFPLTENGIREEMGLDLRPSYNDF
ncbi:M91 family zinc metallopeptidase [Luteimonas sp. A277]